VSERGLPDTLHEYVDEYEERHGITVSLQGEDAARGLPALVAFQLLRIVQEALANVRKHASARTAWISFSTIQGDRLEMIVGDDGTGFDPDALPNTPRKSFGLASMRERVESLGGVLKLESSAGLGTRVIVAIPLQDGAGAPTGGSLASVTG
jgi:signal transduction histidine kinase